MSRFSRLLGPAWPSRKSATARAKKEARLIEGLLEADGARNVPGYSGALLARQLLERELIWASASRILPLFAGFLLTLPLLIFAWPFLTTLWSMTSDQMTTAGSNDPFDALRPEEQFSVVAFYLFFLTLAMVRNWLRRRSWDYQRFMQFAPPRDVARAESDHRILLFSWVLPAIVFGTASVILGWSLSPAELGRAALRLLGAFLWVAIIFVPLAPLTDRRIVIWRAPDAAVSRALANAYMMVVAAKPSQWRDSEYRLRAAAEVCAAAGILESRLLRTLRSIGAPDDAPEWRQLQNVSNGLRRLAASLAASGAMEPRTELRRAIAMALASASAGTLPSLYSDQPGQSPQFAPSWFARTMRATRRVALALVPAIGAGLIVVLGDRYDWALTEEARPLFIQFAVLSVLVGVMSALDPAGYQQRMNSITGAGSSLFAWGKGRGGSAPAA